MGVMFVFSNQVLGMVIGSTIIELVDRELLQKGLLIKRIEEQKKLEQIN